MKTAGCLFFPPSVMNACERTVMCVLCRWFGRKSRDIPSTRCLPLSAALCVFFQVRERRCLSPVMNCCCFNVWLSALRTHWRSSASSLCFLTAVMDRVNTAQFPEPSVKQSFEIFAIHAFCCGSVYHEKSRQN